MRRIAKNHRRNCAAAFHHPLRRAARSRGPLRCPRAAAAATRAELRRRQAPAPRPPRSASSPRSPVASPPWAWASRTRSTWRSSRPTTPTRSPAGSSSSIAVDDEAKADVGKNAATKISSDDAVIGVVGTLNSSVAQQTSRSSRRQDRPGLAGQHQPDPDAGRRRRCQEAAVRELLPHLHHRRGPGSVRGPVPPRPGHQEGRDDPRQEDLRSGPGRRLHR
jgi:hypothetical protein